jgi:hypothetical protein
MRSPGSCTTHIPKPGAGLRRGRERESVSMCTVIGGRRVAIELKYLLRTLRTTIDDEVFDLQFQSAQDGAGTTGSCP